MAKPRARTRRRPPTPRTAPGSDNVVRFPPLPRLPPPPRLPVDPRQRRTMHTIGALARMAEPTMRLSGPNFETGFHASAVDLGRLQAALSRGLSRLDMAQVRERWDELFAWMLRVIRAWVQRYKHVKIEPCENGIRVELETQDDHGYYEYGFDVFPGRSA